MVGITVAVVVLAEEDLEDLEVLVAVGLAEAEVAAVDRVEIGRFL